MRGLRPSLAASASLIAAVAILATLVASQLAFRAWPGDPGSGAPRVAQLAAPAKALRVARAPIGTARRAAVRPVRTSRPIARSHRAAPKPAPHATAPRPVPTTPRAVRPTPPRPTTTAQPAPAATAAPQPAPAGPLESAVAGLRTAAAPVTEPLPAPAQSAGDTVQQAAATADDTLAELGVR